ncbi:uncharacterized protein BDZ99DRAFT_468639 [Mytilinidion resinicola]|uniref:Uncharacterized protein n=1 Tax=Mytilinidion resinicola TaxID=574789 RepID=A0A6A6Y386_9PEZI|nr:uncharacterized protein BDZ99DRAFT_468639 [Mytilinidion resinicola]KAF2802988.1 hypothetical protein BDZ99DRAFT_468639 [Mytilinidion resinicola]
MVTAPLSNRLRIPYCRLEACSKYLIDIPYHGGTPQTLRKGTARRMQGASGSQSCSHTRSQGGQAPTPTATRPGSAVLILELRIKHADDGRNRIMRG